jgi:hypothetical protein
LTNSGKYSSTITDKLQLLALLLFIPAISYTLCAQENFPVGSRAAALANAVVMESDVWSVSHNQAGLGDYHNLSIGFHHENKYVVDEFSLHSLALTVPVKQGTFGFSYTYFGYPKYNESKVGIAFGKSFGEKISAGIQVNYHYVYVAGEYDNRHALTAEGGVQYKPIPALRIGIHIFNPTRSRLAPTNIDTLATTLRAGISYTPVEKLWMALETEKSINNNYRLKSGIEYELLKGLHVRTGIITHPVQNTFGLGFNISRISADVAFSHNQTLGFTPHFSMQVRLK